MDELDYAITDLLKTDGRRPFTEIAHILGVSEGTIRNRVSRLVQDEVLHIVGLVDPNSLGFEAPALIGITIIEGDVEPIATKIAAFPEVSYLIMVSGEFDLFVEVLCRDREHLADFLNHNLRKIPGVGRTESFITLKTFKMAYGASPRSQHRTGEKD